MDRRALFVREEKRERAPDPRSREERTAREEAGGPRDFARVRLSRGWTDLRNALVDTDHRDHSARCSRVVCICVVISAASLGLSLCALAALFA